MPITQFFLFLEQAHVERALNYMELTNIQAVSICDSKYYTHLKEKYKKSVLGEKEEMPEKMPSLQDAEAWESIRNIVPAEKPEAKQAMMKILSFVKGSV